MIAHLVFLIFLLSPPTINAAAAADLAYKSKEHILLNCGSRVLQKSPADGQIWIGDGPTNLSPGISTTGLSIPVVSQNVTRNTPYIFARIVTNISTFSYIFPLSAGQKILRLYFYPDTYTNTLNVSESFDARNSFFDVTANKYTLLNNFSPFTAIEGGWRSAWVQKPAHIVKEFIINVQQTESLNVTFVPSPDSFAFINGIEIVSLPEDLYMGSHDLIKKPLRFVNAPGTQFDINETNTAFETMNRVIMGPTVARVDDTGMFREWVQDSDFVISLLKGNTTSNNNISLTYTPETPDYSAPAAVYKTARHMDHMGEDNPSAKLMWNFEVDSGFIYMLRLHFCEFTPSKFFRAGQRAFNIFINGMEAETVDVIFYAGGTGIPMIRDYVILIANPNGSGRSKHELELALSPDRGSDPQYLDAFVNGVEVFKLSTNDGYLAGVN